MAKYMRQKIVQTQNRRKKMEKNCQIEIGNKVMESWGPTAPCLTTATLIF